MKTTFRLAASLLLLTGIAGCEPLGDGSTVESLELTGASIDAEHGVLVPATESVPQFFKMYDCFCSNISAIASFTDGTRSNFNYRVTFTSSNPAVVEVTSSGDSNTTCPNGQRFPGALIPRSIGTAIVTAEFAGLTQSLEVQVTDTSLAGANITLGPAAPDLVAEVAVGASRQLLLRGTFDGREQFLNLNASGWTLKQADDTDAPSSIGAISSAGVVSGFGRSGADPLTARVGFPTCPITASAPVYIGDINGPLTLAREAPDFATDGKLAVNSDEFIDVTAALDFDGDSIADGSQHLGFSSSLSFTDTCTLREYDASNTTTQCKETAGSTCTNSTPVCTSATATSCTEAMTACRTAAAPILTAAASRIIAFADSATPTHLSATYPAFLGRATTLAADLAAEASTLQVAALSGYPDEAATWFGVIDADGAREVVRVTGYTGTTLTVVRGVAGGGPAVAHASGASFEQRSHTSDAGAPLDITAEAGVLTDIAIAPPGTLAPLSSLQLNAFGTFTDENNVTRIQRITRLNSFASGSPALGWLSSDSSVARFNTATPGLLTSTSACGGTLSVRARSSTSENTVDGTFDADSTADDEACEGTDPLCDQVEICIGRASPLPDGTVCEDPAPVCP